MAENTQNLVKDVNPQTFTEPSVQLKHPGKNFQHRQHARPGHLKGSKKGFHLAKGASVKEMNIRVEKETDYAELVLHVGEITVGEKNRKLMKDCQRRRSQLKVIKRAVCALFNSGGGVVIAHIQNSKYSLPRDGTGQNWGKYFPDILPFPQNYIDPIQKEDDFFIFVKSWEPDTSDQHVITLKTNLYERNMSSLVEVKAANAVMFLKDMKDSEGRSDLRGSLVGKSFCEKLQIECLLTFFNKEMLNFKETFEFTKSTYAEVKLYPTNILEILPRTVSAFANTAGGFLFFGLDGKKQQIIGFEAEESDLLLLENTIKNEIEKLPVIHFCEEKGKIQYTCKFIKVQESGALRSYVCALRVERFCCAVFAAEPDSWYVEDSKVKRFTAEEWVKIHMDATPGFSKVKDKRVLQSSIPPLGPCSWFAYDNPEAQEQSAHLPAESGKVICSPEVLSMELFSQHERFEQLLRTELDLLPEGTLIVSKSCALDLGLPEKQKFILHVLHISQGSLPTLHSFIMGDKELKDDSTILKELGDKLKDHCKQNALTLKQTLINLGGYTGKIGITVKITYLGRTAGPLYDSSLEIHYPRDYYLTTKTVRDLQKAFAELGSPLSPYSLRR